MTPVIPCPHCGNNDPKLIQIVDIYVRFCMVCAKDYLKPLNTIQPKV